MSIREIYGITGVAALWLCCMTFIYWVKKQETRIQDIEKKLELLRKSI
jgi:uncharacterized membrane protein YuzA (DUF378 family)